MFNKNIAKLAGVAKLLACEKKTVCRLMFFKLLVIK